MCGIAGVLYRDPARPPDRAVLKAMGLAIAHRGPDAEGFWSEPGVGLVHRRLSIIDLTGGDQPMANEDQSLQIIFNGEIYNYQSLRNELLAKGHGFKTQSDTEVLLHLYEETGYRLVDKLRGMFAFALWDRARRRLVLGRDRLGIKPLYVYQDSEKIIFGSELKAILAHPNVERRLNLPALEDYLTFGMVPGPASIFCSVSKLPPAHTLTLSADSWDSVPKKYWNLTFKSDESPSAGQWQEALRAKLEETVKLHLIADVPVGAFLSGGVDSSVMVALSAGTTQGRLRTFSMGFAEDAFSELPYARQVAGRFQTDHVEEIVTPDAVHLVDDLTQHFDEPFADSSAIPTYLVSRLAARHVKVVLSGDGGDEAFGGYSRYAHDLMEARLRKSMPTWFRQGLLGPLGRIWPKADWLPRPLRAKTLLTNLALDPSQAYANTLSLCRAPLRRRLLSPDLLRNLNGHQPESRIQQHYQNLENADDLSCMIAADMGTLLPDDFLVKVDRASMAHGLEVRPPLLDHELLELAARIPSALKIRQGKTKWILKETFRNQLPHDIIERKKQGFELPIDQWLRGPLSEMTRASLLEKSSPIADLLDRGVTQTLFKAHDAGLANHGSILWSLLMLSRWADKYMTTPPKNEMSQQNAGLHKLKS